MMKFMKSLIVLTLLSNFIFSSCRTLKKEKEVKEEVTIEEVKKDSVVVKDTLKEKVKQEAKVVDKAILMKITPLSFIISKMEILYL